MNTLTAGNSASCNRPIGKKAVNLGAELDVDELNRVPVPEPLPPRLRLFQSVLAIAVFSVVPLWPANAQAASGPADAAVFASPASPGR
jgi:hypothetical protein